MLDYKYFYLAPGGILSCGRSRLVEDNIAFIVYVVYDYIIKKQINEQIIHASFGVLYIL